MKSIIFLSLIVTFAAFAAKTEPRVVELKTEKVGEVIHWMPEKVEVTQGEKVRFRATHELEGGFDFHGLNIPVLKIAGQVNRNTPFEPAPVTIPKSLKPGEYPIGCQFHPKHAAATLVVKVKAK
ncbi:MAG: cupredoxin domain-containing protein [Deltaproteobacteria bacterium]|nr:cupredoxin domain-containing protein [Deltaproteobacteria bacterium]MBI3295409.1 cupredoxin domain-containing protein [Deltaproteobacteria bacterium]